MFGSTMMLTIGQALDRAKDEELSVRMLLGGEWISGRILSCEGMAVAVLETSGDLCVVRMDTISCVRMPALAAHKAPAPPSQPTGGARHQARILEASGAS